MNDYGCRDLRDSALVLRNHANQMFLRMTLTPYIVTGPLSLVPNWDNKTSG